MEETPEQLHQYVEELLHDQQPERAQLGSEEALEAWQAAAMLAAARPGAGLPGTAFIKRVEHAIDAGRPGAALATQQPSGFSRRQVIVGAAGGIAAAVLATIGVERGVEALRPLAGRLALVPARQGNWQSVMAVAALPNGAPIQFHKGALEGYLFRTSEGARGISAVCTHMGCLLNWSSLRTRFECPCHGAVFDAHGAPQGRYGLALRPLPALQVRIQDGDVQVYTV
jgi:Rieske Fe-S protein